MRRLLSLFLLLIAANVTIACSSNDFYRGHVETNGLASAQAFHVKDGVQEAITSKYVIQGQGAATVQTIKPYLTLDGNWQATAETADNEPHEEPGAVLLRPTFGAPTPTRAANCDGQPVLLIPLPTSPEGVCPGGACVTPPAAPHTMVAPPSDVIPLAKQYVGMATAWTVVPEPKGAYVNSDGAVVKDGRIIANPVPGSPWVVEGGQAVSRGSYSMPACAPAVMAAPLPAAAPACRPVYHGCDGTPGGTQVGNPSTGLKPLAPGTGWPCGTSPVPGVVGALAVPPGFLIHAGGCLIDAVACIFSFP